MNKEKEVQLEINDNNLKVYFIIFSVSVLIISLLFQSVIIPFFKNLFKYKKIKGFGIDIEKGDKDDEQVIISRGDFMYSISSVIDIVIKIDRIKTHTIISDQMTKASEIIILIKDLYITNFRKLLAKELEGQDISPTEHREYYFYRNVIREYGDIINDFFKVAFLNNGIHNLSTVDFNTYIEKKVSVLMKKTEEFFDDVYIGNRLIPRQILYKMELEFYDNIQNLIYHVFSDAQKIAIKYNKQMMELEEQKQNIIQQTINRKEVA